MKKSLPLYVVLLALNALWLISCDKKQTASSLTAAADSLQLFGAKYKAKAAKWDSLMAHADRFRHKKRKLDSMARLINSGPMDVQLSHALLLNYVNDANKGSHALYSNWVSADAIEYLASWIEDNNYTIDGIRVYMTEFKDNTPNPYGGAALVANQKSVLLVCTQPDANAAYHDDFYPAFNATNDNDAPYIEDFSDPWPTYNSTYSVLTGMQLASANYGTFVQSKQKPQPKP